VPAAKKSATKKPAPKNSTAAALTRALAALDRGDDPAAIEALSEAWAQRRSPALAELVDLIDARLPKRPYAELLATKVDTTTKRLRAADTDDPRVSRVLLELLEHPRFLSDQAFWDLVLDLVEACADPRFQTPGRRAPRSSMRRTLYARLSPAALRYRVVQRLDALSLAIPPVREPTDEETKLERQISSRLGSAKARRDDEDKVLREIYEDPLADAPRLVYADLLLERGDPRGELITLQFERRDKGLDESKKARERWLLKQHMKDWLGGLAPAVSNTQSYSRSTFERGFVAIADIYNSAEKQLPLTWKEPGWATVEELHGPYKSLVFECAPLRGLRRIREGASIETLALFARYAEKFKLVDELELYHPDELGGVARTALRRCVLPALRSLTIVTSELRIADVQWLIAEAAMKSPLERVVIAATPGVSDHAKAMFDSVVDAVTSMTGRVAQVGIVPPWQRWPRPAPFELVRGANGFYGLPG
jgi:uncharacterized protein (TIGR02996 family)